MSDKNQPVSLPAGAFDYDTLKDGLEKAAKGADKNYDQGVADTLDKAQDKAFEPVDPRELPGHKFVTVDNALGGEETIQVFDPKLADKIVDTGEAATAAPLVQQPDAATSGKGDK